MEKDTGHECPPKPETCWMCECERAEARVKELEESHRRRAAHNLIEESCDIAESEGNGSIADEIRIMNEAAAKLDEANALLEPENRIATLERELERLQQQHTPGDDLCDCQECVLKRELAEAKNKVYELEQSNDLQTDRISQLDQEVDELVEAQRGADYWKTWAEGVEGAFLALSPPENIPADVYVDQLGTHEMRYSEGQDTDGDPYCAGADFASAIRRATIEAKDAEIAELFKNIGNCEDMRLEAGNRADAAEARVKELEEQRARLWMLLDNIDTAEDMFKPTIGPHFQYVNRKHRQRFDVWNPADDDIDAHKHVSRIAALESEIAGGTWKIVADALEWAINPRTLSQDVIEKIERCRHSEFREARADRITALEHELAEAKKDSARLVDAVKHSLGILADESRSDGMIVSTKLLNKAMRPLRDAVDEAGGEG